MALPGTLDESSSSEVGVPGLYGLKRALRLLFLLDAFELLPPGFGVPPVPGSAGDAPGTGVGGRW